MKRKLLFISVTILLGLLVIITFPTGAWADDTEELGPPTISLPSRASGIAMSGATPHDSGATTITTTVPEGVTVNKVLLYWYVGLYDDSPASEIGVEETTIAGTRIGGSTPFFHHDDTDGGWVYFTGFRADITDKGWIVPGLSEITVDLPFDTIEEAVGIVAIYDDGVSEMDLHLLDGLDLAHFRFDAPVDKTAPQTITFAPVEESRKAELVLWVGSLEPDRPYRVIIDVGGEHQELDLLLGGAYGQWWESIRLAQTIPTGATELTVEVVSTAIYEPLGASLAWEGVALLLPPPPPPLSSITIIKEVEDRVPDSPWAYTGDLGSFTLPANGGSKTFDDLTAGSYTISEVVHPDYDVDVICDTKDRGKESVTIDLPPDRHYTCVFHNRPKKASITVIKEVEGRPESEWAYTGTLGAFTLPANGGSITFAELRPGFYTISEVVQENYEVVVTCDSNANGIDSVTVDLPPGEHVTCTFVNTHIPLSSITVIKELDGRAPESEWAYTGDLGAFTLPADGGSITFEDLAPGTYTIGEVMQENYDAEVSCGSGESGNDNVTVDLVRGEHVTCTFVNRLKKGNITIIKEVDGQAPDSPWAYTGDLGAFTLPADGGSKAFAELTPGLYTIGETVQDNYEVTVTCGSNDSGIDSVTVDLPPGEHITCTFVNRTLPKVEVDRRCTFEWSYTVTNPTMIRLENVRVFPAPGVALSCDPDTPATLSLGQSMTCTAESDSRAACESGAWVYGEAAGTGNPVMRWIEAESCTAP